jgi:hypothetical protein
MAVSAGGLKETMEAVKAGKKICTLVHSWWQRLFKTKRIGFFGIPGIGKSVLFDYLNGRGLQPNYVLPPASTRAENRRVVFRTQHAALCVVPGQDSPPKQEAIDNLFREKAVVDGIIYVVANGLPQLRNPVARKKLIKDNKITTVAKFQKHHKVLELDELRAVCERIQLSLRGATRKPKWMMVAVTKTDLYQSQLGDVCEYYSPEGESPFADYMRGFMSRVGTDNFSWQMAPVCCCLEPFEWNGECLESQVTERQRNAQLVRFLEQLEKSCG